MNETNNETITTGNKSAAAGNQNIDYARYLAYQEAIKSLRGNADGGK